MTSVLFGEIVEPSTRALIDEDLEEYPDYLEISPEWEKEVAVPDVINFLIFVESKIIKDLVFNCVLLYDKAICKMTNGGIEIFSLPNDKYLVVQKEENALNHGQIVEFLEDWILRAKCIYAITSDTIYNYQNPLLVERPASLVRILTNTENTFNFTKLEQPNLITGLTAHVLSFCIHQCLKKCTLFVIYLDKSVLDSYSSGTALNIFKKLGIPLRNSNIKTETFTSNLYM